ncbi:MAG: GTP-binding protein [Actinomycetota bacterium]|nr:GTP-binding protein [Actinomycetota bacterium]
MTLLLPESEPESGAVAGGRRGVILLSGFLGSGKTTLLRAELQRTGPAGPAVVVNDFGHTAVDDVLLGEGRDAPTVISGGCACCSRREELAVVLRQMLDAEHRRATRAAHHVVVETSGLSDPGPIAFTLANDPVLRHHYELTRICVTVDALTGLATLEEHDVARRQLLAADHLLVTKADLVGAQAAQDLVARLRQLSPMAQISVTAAGELVGRQHVPDVPARAATAPARQQAAHLEDVRTLELVTSAALDWQAFTVWLTLLLHRHGPRVLRVKGVLDVEGVGAVSVNGVQHVLHEPQHLTGSVPAGSRLVLILRGLHPDVVERSFFVLQNIERSEQRRS